MVARAARQDALVSSGLRLVGAAALVGLGAVAVKRAGGLEMLRDQLLRAF